MHDVHALAQTLVQQHNNKDDIRRNDVSDIRNNFVGSEGEDNDS